ncbi:MAG: sigma-E processing peptidase SpoIIGA [Clostridiales bacterium]|nr:sigma-E processing peptidase SpoIIGA [Clostridiales bacterium]
MNYEWYIDVFFLVNFLMDASALIFAAVCRNRRTAPVRIFLVSAVSVCAGILFLLYAGSWFFYMLLVHSIINPAMTAAAFAPESPGEFIRLLLTVYVFVIFAGGAQEFLLRQSGMGGAGAVLVDGITAMALFAMWMIRFRVLCATCAVELCFHGQRLTLTAYCDSGNLLCHPKSGRPVSIVEKIRLPDSWLRQFGEPERIPARTVNGSSARMEVITLDKMNIYLRGTVKEIKAPLIGLCDETLVRSDVQMLLNSELFL